MSKSQMLQVFGPRLAKLIEKAGFSQTSFANAIGTSQSTIHKYIHKQQMPSASVILKMSKVLGCTVEELIDFE